MWWSRVRLERTSRASVGTRDSLAAVLVSAKAQSLGCLVEAASSDLLVPSVKKRVCQKRFCKLQTAMLMSVCILEEAMHAHRSWLTQGRTALCLAEPRLRAKRTSFL